MSDPTPRQSSRQVGGRPRKYLTVEPPPAVLAMAEAIAASEETTVVAILEPAIRRAVLAALTEDHGMPFIVPPDVPWKIS